MIHHDWRIEIQVPQRPGWLDNHPPQTGIERIVQTTDKRITFANLDIHGGIFLNRHRHRSVIRLIEIREGNHNGRVLVQVLHPLDQFCLVLVSRTQIQPLHHVQHRRLGLKDDNLVVKRIH